MVVSFHLVPQNSNKASDNFPVRYSTRDLLSAMAAGNASQTTPVQITHVLCCVILHISCCAILISVRVLLYSVRVHLSPCE